MRHFLSLPNAVEPLAGSVPATAPARLLVAGTRQALRVLPREGGALR